MANKSTPNIAPLNSNPEMDGYGSGTSWLIQPIAASEMYQNFELSQLRTMLTIVRRLQSPINNVINGSRPGEELSLFKQGEIQFDEKIVSENQIPIQLKLSDITADPTRYKEIKTVLDKMQSTNISYITINEKDGKEYRVVEPFVAKFIFPKQKRIHSFHVVLSHKVAEMLVDMRGMAWHRILENVILDSKNTSTQSLYLYLSAQLGKNNVSFDIDTSELRRQAGTTKVEYKMDSDTNEYVMTDRKGYTQWGMFVSRVLQPAVEELKSKYDESKCDLYFEWSPVYHEGRARRGEPDEVHIIIHSFNNEKQIEKASLDISELQKIATERFGIRASNFATLSKRIETQSFANELLEEMKCIDARVTGDKRTSKYFYASIKNFIEEHDRAEAEKKEQTKRQETNPQSHETDAHIIEQLRTEFGNGQMGFDYLFGKRCQVRVGEGQCQISVPRSMVDAITSNIRIMERIKRIAGDDVQIVAY